MTGDALPGAPLDAAQLDDLEERLRRFDGVAWDAGPVFAVIDALRAAWRENERYRSALEHYAYLGNWDTDTLDMPDGSCRVYEPVEGPHVTDGWEIARAALGAPGVARPPNEGATT